LSSAASAEGPRPKRIATPTTPSSSSMTMFDSSSTLASGVHSSVSATLVAVAHA
jgi:hypothetical protein